MTSIKAIVIIPAKSDSTRLPGKNKKVISGKTLVEHSILYAQSSTHVDRIIVSTDDLEIAEIAKSYGAEVPFLRDKNIANDNSTRNEVIKDAINKIKGYKNLILLQPTSPLRNHQHIDEAYQLFLKLNSKSCVSVREQHPSPEWMFKPKKDYKLEPIFKNKILIRQNLPKYLSLNGAIFLIKINYFIKSKTEDPFITKNTTYYLMDDLSSIDIDTELDWHMAEFLNKKYILNQSSTFK